MMNPRYPALVLTAFLLGGCNGGKTVTNLIGQGAASTSAAARPAVTAHFVIVVPPAPAGSLKAKYVSAGTKSVSIGLTGSTTGTTTVNVTAGQSTYNVNVSAFSGSNTFTVNLYDTANGTGNLLSTAQVTATLSTTQADVVNVTTLGVPASVQLSLDNATPRKGIATTVHLTVGANDAAGFTIVGTYTQSITLTNSDATGKIALASTTATGPATVNVTYNGGNVGATTLGVSGFTGSVTTAVLTPSLVNTGVVTTLAGQSQWIPYPTNNSYNAAVRDSGGNLFVIQNKEIDKLSAAGVYSTFAGQSNSGFVNGTGTAAKFSLPFGLTLDGQGNFYVADASNNAIRKIDPNGVVTTLAGQSASGFTNGTGTAARFKAPEDVTVDVSGNVYVADTSNNVIRKIDPGGVVTTLAGQSTSGFTNGTGTAAQFSSPDGVAVDASGNVYVADLHNSAIRKIDPGGVVTTLAGQSASGFTNGTGTAAQFFSPDGVAVDASGNVYVADASNNAIRKIDPGGVVTTLAGQSTSGFTDGTGTAAQFNSPETIKIDSSGNLIVYDSLNNAVRMVTTSGVVTTLLRSSAGYTDATGTAAAFYTPEGVAVDANDNIYVADQTNNAIRKIDANSVVTTLAGQSTSGRTDGTGTAAQFNEPTGITVDGSSNVYVFDAANFAIRKIDPNGVVTTLAGHSSGFADGTGTAAKFSGATGITVDGAGNLYVADTSNNAIRLVTPAGVVTTLAGQKTSGFTNGTGTAAQFNQPYGIAVDDTGTVYVADTSNNAIRKITSGGVVTTLAGQSASGFVNGTGTAAQFSSPKGIGVDSAGNLYVSDTGNSALRLVTPAGVVTTLAGSTSGGYADGTGVTAKFNGPFGVAVDSNAILYIGDSNNNLIRKVQ